MGVSANVVNGSYADANNFQVDGVSNNEATLGLIAVNPSVDAIGEFKVQTNTYAAEFGRAGGANVSVAIKSGANKFHGTAFAFVRNDIFDATPWTVNRVRGEKPPLPETPFARNCW